MNNCSTVVRSDEIWIGQLWRCTCKDINLGGVVIENYGGDNVYYKAIWRPNGVVRMNIFTFVQCFKLSFDVK